MVIIKRVARAVSAVVCLAFVTVLCGLWLQQGVPLAVAGPLQVAEAPAGAPESEAAAEAEPVQGNEIITGKTIFFGCAVGAAVGVVFAALPPVAGWAMVAGALPGVAAVALTSGVGCSVGLFSGVIISTVGWIFGKIGAAWSAIF